MSERMLESLKLSCHAKDQVSLGFDMHLYL